MSWLQNPVVVASVHLIQHNYIDARILHENGYTYLYIRSKAIIVGWNESSIAGARCLFVHDLFKASKSDIHSGQSH